MGAVVVVGGAVLAFATVLLIRFEIPIQGDV
jgi:hypothetical protein